MESPTSFYVLVVAVAAYYATLAFYRLFLDPLARFPGPKAAAVSRWYEAYYDVFLGGKYTFKIAQLHKEYGPIIRISPYELHVADPAFFETLYRLDGRWDKYSWTYDAFGASDSTVFGSEHDSHKIRRRAIAPFFSKPNVLARQDMLQRYVDKLCSRISDHRGSTFNLGAAISAFVRDVTNEYILGKTYNDLELDDFGVAISIASHGGGTFWRATKHIRWFGPLVKAIPVGVTMRLAGGGTKAFLRFLQQTRQDTREALEKATSPSGRTDGDNTQNTMVDAIANSNLPPAEKRPRRVLQEVGTTLGAGYETTASNLRLVLYHVYSNEAILRRLRRELDGLGSTGELADLKQLQNLPYLRAVLTEGMRLSPGIATRAARITDKDLLCHEWRIPAGTPVGMTAYLMHTDEALYPEPMRFNPDRWLGSTGVVADPRFYAPLFARHENVSRHAMYMVLAALVQGFDFTIKNATAKDFEAETDNFGIGTRAGSTLHAHVTARSL
ncbi:cytochrome P450 [Apiospora kogelbergensis]|uniref:cytochrome P450 n=1 Tax=Apiospora kogelbergensis TaxID=1337665 RepID=UPI003131EE73